MEAFATFTPWFLKWPLDLHEMYAALVAVGAAIIMGRKLWRSLQPNRKVQHGIERIGFHFRTKNTLHIYGIYRELPTIEMTGRFVLTREEKLVQARLPIPKVNDSHAVLVVEPDWSQSKLDFEVRGLEYHELKAVRTVIHEEVRSGLGLLRTAHVVSANAVILCREDRKLILHYRSSSSDTYPLCYHTIGGGYMPPGITAKDDLLSLKNTLTREVDEEVRIKLAFDETPQLLVMEEVRTGFIQVAFLGINITAEQANELPDNPRPIEGKPIQLPFDELPALLSRSDWVPTGKAAVIAWLALGAPGAGPYPRFGNYSAAALCEHILGSTHIEGGNVAMKQVASH